MRFSGGFLEVFDASFGKSDLYSGRFSKANVVWLGVFETKSVLGSENGLGFTAWTGPKNVKGLEVLHELSK